MNTDAVKERMRTMGNTAKAGTPEEFTQTVAEYVARWTGVIEQLGIPAGEPRKGQPKRRTGVTRPQPGEAGRLD